jgi:hypothetical protein
MGNQAIGAASVAEDGNSELLCPRCEGMFARGGRCPIDGATLIRVVVADPLVGRELDGRFTILEKLGFGGMGAVYRARQHSVDREVAIKVIHPALLADPAVIKRFLREARLASRLNHPNAVGVLDFGQTGDGMFYLVMELLTGRTLDEVIGAEGRFEPRRVAKLGIQICDALEAAHALSIVHRDLKPENVMVLESARDFVKVLDFGLAKSLEQDAAMDVSISGVLQGTPQYVAPERACGQPGDARSDLYSLGCMLYQLVTGSLPFEAPAMHDLLMKHVTERPPAMDGVPEPLAQVILRLLAKRLDDRYPSAAATSAALEAVLEVLPARAATDPGLPGPEPVTPPPAALPSPVPGPVGVRHATPAEQARIARSDTMVAPVTRSPRRRHRLVLAGVGAIVIAVVGAVLIRSTTVTTARADRAVVQPEPHPGTPPVAAEETPAVITPPTVAPVAEKPAPARRDDGKSAKRPARRAAPPARPGTITLPF